MLFTKDELAALATMPDETFDRLRASARVGAIEGEAFEQEVERLREARGGVNAEFHRVLAEAGVPVKSWRQTARVARRGREEVAEIRRLREAGIPAVSEELAERSTLDLLGEIETVLTDQATAAAGVPLRPAVDPGGVPDFAAMGALAEDIAAGQCAAARELFGDADGARDVRESAAARRGNRGRR